METKRGRVLRDTNAGPGLVTVEGKQYSFTLEEMWISDVPPRPGLVVDVTFNGEGAPSSVSAIPESQLAREQVQQAFADARKHSAALTSGLRSRFGLAAILAEALLLIAFFLLPNMRVGNGFTSRLLNGWDAIGLDPATTATNSHGLLSLLTIGLFAPIAVPFLNKAWSRWLYAAPLCFAGVASVSVFYEIENTGRAARQAIGDVFGSAAAGSHFGNPMSGMFSPAIGAFLVLLCSLYLLTRMFHAEPA